MRIPALHHHHLTNLTPEPVLALSALLLVAGGIVMQFFTILSGAVNSAPLNQFYFLEATTSGIPNARNPSRWTFFAVCGRDPSTGHNTNCGAVVPALPFDPHATLAPPRTSPSSLSAPTCTFTCRASCSPFT